MKKRTNIECRQMMLLEAARASLIEHLGKKISVNDFRFVNALIDVDTKTKQSKEVVNGTVACGGKDAIAFAVIFKHEGSTLAFEAQGIPFTKVDLDYPKTFKTLLR